MSPGINKNSSKNSISIIVSFLNGEKFIQESIESVFAQTYSHWELFLIDDGSTDGSTKIARQYAERYPEKVRYLEHKEHKNLGTSVSRILGIDKSNGEYIAFLDADDVWLSRKLEEQMAIMHVHPGVAMVYGPVLFWYSWTGKPEDVGRDQVQKFNIKQDTVAKPPLSFRNLLKMDVYDPYPSCLLIRRKVIELRGEFKESFPGIFEDEVFNVKVFLEEPVFVASQIWCKYRQHQDSICHSINIQEYRLLSERFWKWVKQYLTNKGVKDEETLSIVDEHIRKSVWVG